MIIRSKPKTAFSYYGSKSRVASKYPKPQMDTIIEPFAGTAAYSQLWWDRRVILYDINPVIIETWKYLIAATRNDILALPDVHRGTDIHEFDIPKGAKNLIGFWINPGATRPGRSPTAHGVKKRWWNKDKPGIAEIVYHFNRWEVHCESYENAPNVPATWFIDPPYKHGGEYYQFRDVDYANIAKFALSRQGEVMVCENTKASWLPFIPLTTNRGYHKTTTEALYHRANSGRKE
jgi:site-specific DNA-adenine methylase